MINEEMTCIGVKPGYWNFLQLLLASHAVCAVASTQLY